ncbi:MAG: NAD(P)H-dependent oxidoreductase [Gammaproteobacteria bacterium]|nr:NAD(P)H-dependent oxidoreductase [Gammaproteobacteria bacterium]
MRQRICIIQGHPDAGGNHLCHALADAYAAGAADAGHEVRRIEVSRLEFPLVRTREEFEQGDLPQDIAEAQEAIRQATHLVIVYPLWLGTMPALLKGFFEQTFRYGFAIGTESERMPAKLLRGRSARLVVTMGMPALVYRWYFRAHSVKSLERNVLGLAGISPVRETLIGSVDAIDEAKGKRCLATMRALGERAR